MIAEQPMIADGIYPNVDAKVYFHAPEWSGRMSPSVLENATEKKDGGGTMAHVKAAFDGKGDSDTNAFSFGRAAHCRLLEPERFRKEFAQVERCNGYTKDGKGPRCSKLGIGRFGAEWLCSSHAPDGYASDVEVYSEEDAAMIEAIRARIFAHDAVNILKQSGGCEVCIAWTCPRTGVKCKSRLDKWMPEVYGVDYSLILDLKFVRCASERAIKYALRDYGWARAAAMRLDGIEALTGQRPKYCLIAAEKSEPYEVSVPFIGEQTMRGALWDVRTNLATWAACVKEGVYPGYGGDFLEVETTGDELRRYEDLVPENFGE